MTTTGSDWYGFTCDPAGWRESVGAPEGSADAAEWQAYVRGEVFTYAVQELTTWRTDDGRARESWETVDACGGFYGTTWAEESAREAFSQYVDA